MKRFSSIKNNGFLESIGRSKGKTWTSRMPKTGAIQESKEDAEGDSYQANDAIRKGLVLSLPYEDIANGLRSQSSCDYRDASMSTGTRPLTAGPTSKEETRRQDREPRPASALAHHPGHQNKPKGLKKVVSLLNIRKPKTKSISPQINTPTLLTLSNLPSVEFFPCYPDSPSSIPPSPYADLFTPSLASTTEAEPEPDTPLTDIAPTIEAALERATPLIDIAPTTPSPKITPIPEENEDATILSTKQVIRQIKLSDIASTQRALHLAYTAQETGIATLSRLNEQSERLTAAETYLQTTPFQIHHAEERIRELKPTTTRIHLTNPFFSPPRIANLDDPLVRANQMERARRAALRREKMEEALRKRVTVFSTEVVDGEERVVERLKYQFEPDEEDEWLEEEIERNLGELGKMVPRLKEMIGEIGGKVEEQKGRMEEMSERVWWK